MSRPLPPTLEAFDRERKKFVAFVVSQGSEILKSPNKYEVLRFTGPDGVAIIYRNESGRITHWANGADYAFLAFLKREEWRAIPKTDRVTGSKARHRHAQILERDGDTCFLCGLSMPPEDQSLEHIVAVTHQGPNHLSNLALMHKACNNEIGHLSAREKFEIALKRRMKNVAE